ncbi:MAG: PKD domain-containing protein [Flavobacteriales bacterium]|nr:PKD domain-containing protein [Flavobacteriales bacterium]
MKNAYAIAIRSSKLLAAAAFAGLAFAAHGQLNVAAVGVTYTINFDGTVTDVSNGTWAGSGFQPNPIAGRLDSDAWAVNGWNDGNLAFGGVRVTAGTDFTRGVSGGGTAVGGMYAFQGAPISGRALGFQPGTGDFQPGNVTLRILNNTGATLTEFDLAYNVYIRNDQDRSSTFNFAYSTDDVTYTFVPAVGITSPGLATGPAWVLNPRSTSVSGFTVPNGAYFYIRWSSNFVSGVGGYDEFALDDIQVTAQARTLVRMAAPLSANVPEDAAPVPITVSIVNPSAVNSTSVDLVLLSGDATRLDNYTTQTVTFPAGSAANEVVNITITDNGACDGDFSNVFELQNVTGGDGPASIGAPTQFTLNVDDDETSTPERRQYFDGLPADNWTMLSGFGGLSVDPGATDVPANQRILSGTTSLQTINTTRTLNLATISVLGFSNVKVVARVSCTGNNAIQGAEVGDDVRFFVDLDGGGFPVTPEITVTGNNNARWGYATGTGVASTSVGVPVTFTPAGGGDRTTDGYSFVEITVPAGAQTIALRVVSRNNNVGERWNVDNVAVEGVLCEPIYYSRADGSETNPVWSTTRTGLPVPFTPTFDKNATMVVQNTHTITSTGGAFSLKDLIVETGGTLDLSPSSNVSIYGPDLTVDGDLNAPEADFELLSDSLTVIGGSTTRIDMRNVTLDGLGTRVDIDSLRIHGTLLLNNGDFDANNREVQLVSTATYTANLGPIAPTASYTSRLRIERYIPAGVTNWRLLCSPVLNKTVADWTDDFLTAGFPGSYYPNFYNPPGSMTLWPSVRKYEETNPGPGPNAGLIGVSSVSEPLTIGRGFTAWSGTTLTTTTAFVIDVRGFPQTGLTPVTLPMTYTNTGAPIVDGLNLVGNPLPSPIDFGSISLGPDVSNYYIVFDPVAGVNATWDEGLQLSVPSGALNGNIQSSQGFWLKANGPNFTTTVSESAKVTDPNGGGLFGGFSGVPAPLFRLRINGPGGYLDEALVHAGVGDEGTGAYDIHKFAFVDALGPYIATRSSTGDDLTINAWGGLQNGAAIPVSVGSTSAGTHVITFFDAEGLTGLTCLELEDLETGVTTPLTEGAQYAFTMADGVSPTNRFVVHVRPSALFSASDALCAGSNDGTATVEASGTGPFDYVWMNAMGNVIASEIGAVGPSTLSGLAPGTYTINIGGNADCGALTQTFTISEPGVLTATSVSTPATCAASSDGSASINVQGGVLPYAISWSNGASGEVLVDVPAAVFTANVVDGNGCLLSLPAIEVLAGPGPTAVFEVADSVVFAGVPVEFFNYSTSGASSWWEFGDGTTSSDTEPMHIFDLPGAYQVTLTVTDGDCQSVVTQEVWVNTSTSVNDVSMEDVRIWFDGHSIVLELDALPDGPMQVDVLATDGRVLLTSPLPGAQGRQILPLPVWADGAYLVRCISGERTFMGRIVIAR